MSGQRNPDGRHPDAAALAEYQAGLIDGRRGKRLAAHVANCSQCASVSDQLTAVSSALAAAPVPPLPDAVGSRITAALATEAAEQSTTEEPRHTAPQHLSALGPSQQPHGRTGPRSSRGDTPGPPRRPRGIRGGRRPRLAVLMSAVAVACLVVFGAVFGLIHLSSGSSSSSAAGSSGSAPSSGPAIAAPAEVPADGHAAGSAEKATFAVSRSGTQYEPATLAAQVRTQLAAKSRSPESTQLQSGAPSAALAACVLHLTDQARPSLVDWATYQGQPAYVIAVPHHAWVVGPDCTASDSHLITSIRL